MPLWLLTLGATRVAFEEIGSINGTAAILALVSMLSEVFHGLAAVVWLNQGCLPEWGSAPPSRSNPEL